MRLSILDVRVPDPKLKLTVRIIVGGFALWLGGRLTGVLDVSLGVELAIGVVSWLIYLELVYGAPVRAGRRALRRLEAHDRARDTIAQECRELAARVMAPDFQATTVAPGELKITLDSAAELLERPARKGGR